MNSLYPTSHIFNFNFHKLINNQRKIKKHMQLKKYAFENVRSRIRKMQSCQPVCINKIYGFDNVLHRIDVYNIIKYVEKICKILMWLSKLLPLR